MKMKKEFTQELEDTLANVITLWDATTILEDEDTIKEVKEEAYTLILDLSNEELEAIDEFMTDLRKFLGTGKEQLLIQKLWSFDVYTMIGEELEHRTEEEK